jgi:hydroxyacylglutathione hydrolase
MGAITGDFIFVGDVGRPDLLERAAGQSGTMEAGARELFASIQKFKTRPDYLQIWPGHGAGSACGKALGAMPQTTLGYEKLFNWGLSETDVERFSATVLAGQPDPPAYFARMKHINRDGTPQQNVRTPPVVSASDVVHALASGAIVVDTRPTADFSARHTSGTINIPQSRSFLTYSGTVLPYDTPIYYIGGGGDDARRQLAVDLSLIGLDSIAGVLPTEQLDAVNEISPPAQIETTEVHDVASARHAIVIDVRSRAEYAQGHLRNAINIPLGELQSRIAEVPETSVIVHCQGGARSVIAASILQKEQRPGVLNMRGGFGEWERSGLPVERGSRTADR